MIHKPTFLHQNKPLITAMVQATNPDDLIHLVRTAAFDGADAYGFQFEKLERKYQNEETVKNIFATMAPRPIYATNYRVAFNQGKSDEELAEGYLWLCDMGATLIDVIGDLYSPSQYEITRDPVAIEKQKALINQIHAKGCEVLMSSHTHTFMSTEVVLDIAREHQARGADISKIVTAANSEEEELENLKTATVLRRELDIPFLFLSGGTHNHLHRSFGPMFGSCMWLTVPLYDECATPSQPLLRSIRAIKDNFDNI
jgi:3-dehydroquinate dehydratase